MCLVAGVALVPARSLGQERVYTSNEDFDRGTSVRVNDTDVPDQLQLDSHVLEFPFVWVVKTGRKTIVRIDANSGQVLGEYRTAPDGHSGNPSRTVVDGAGNVWVGNSSEGAGGRGSVAKIGLVIGGTRGRKNLDGSFTPDAAGAYLAPPFLHSTAVDRDGDGFIRTSRGLGTAMLWPDQGDGLGGPTAEVQDAEDECILLYQRTSATDILHLSLGVDGRIWAGGFQSAPTGFDVLDPATGAILQSMLLTCGGYGGVIDAQGVLWSASFNQGTVQRHDPMSGTSACVPVPMAAGVAVDAQGYAWCSMWNRNSVAKLTPQGSMVAGFPKQTGGGDCFGIAIGQDGDVWVANKRTNDVSRLDAAGNVRKRIAVGLAPTGVAVDIRGRIWVVNQNTHNVVRIDPQAGTDGLGAMDLAVALGTGASPIAYGGMTGCVTVREVEASGSWTVVVDGEHDELNWSRIAWTCSEPGASRIQVDVRTAEQEADLELGAWVPATNAADLESTGLAGRFLQLRARFEADLGARLSPELHEVRVAAVVAEANEAPDCAQATTNVQILWPPDGRMVPVEITGVAEPDGDAMNCRITRIMQDEAVRSDFGADARGIGSAMAYLRAERDGYGNGRVYTILFEVDDGRGGSCEGSVTVCVPHDMGRGHACANDGMLFDSTLGGETLDADNYPNPFNPQTTIRYNLPAAATVQLVIYDALGRRVRQLVGSYRQAGMQTARWDGLNEAGISVASGVYIYHLSAGTQEVSGRMLLLK